MTQPIPPSQTRAYLMKKLLTICPICKKMIFGRDINLDSVDKTKVSSWPIRYTHSHEHINHPMHSITMFLDANLSVRTLEIPKLRIIN